MLNYKTLLLWSSTLIAFTILSGTVLSNLNTSADMLFGTVNGKVKAPASCMLETGKAVNAKMKSLAAGTEVAYRANDNHIHAFRRADSLPEGFEPSTANTISAESAEHPIYIFFDSTDSADVMYYYTDGDKVIMPEDSSFLFSGNNALSDISGLADFDSSNTTDLTAFLADTAIINVDALSAWETSNVRSLSLAFGIDITSYNDDGVRSQLTDVSGLSNWDTSNVTNMSFLFESAEKLLSAEAIENWDTGKVTNTACMFAWTDLITSLDLSRWDMSNVTSMFGMFLGMESLTSLNMSNWSIEKVTDLSFMFSGDKALQTIDVTGWNTGNVTNMAWMFQVGDSHVGNGQLREIKGIGDWDVSHVTDMTGMFYGAGNMTHYDIADWNVSKVESMNHLFCDNFKLESLDLSKWDVSSVKTMYDMFDDAYALKTIGDVSRWNTANLIDIGGWLNFASSFVGENGMLDLSGWDTRKLKAVGEAFRATKLTTIDLSGWDFSAVTNASWEGAGNGMYYETGNTFGYKGFASMFLDMPQLQTVYVSPAGLDSYNAAVANGADTTNMWSGSNISDFTVKPKQSRNNGLQDRLFLNFNDNLNHMPT